MERSGETFLNQIKEQAMKEYYRSKKIKQEYDQTSLSCKNDHVSGYSSDNPTNSYEIDKDKKTFFTTRENFKLDLTVPPPSIFSMPPPMIFPVPPPIASNRRNNLIQLTSGYNHIQSKSHRKIHNTNEPLPPGIEDEEYTEMTKDNKRHGKRAPKSGKKKKTVNRFGLPPSSYKYNRLKKHESSTELPKKVTMQPDCDDNATIQYAQSKENLKLKSKISLFGKTITETKKIETSVESIENTTKINDDGDNEIEEVKILSETNVKGTFKSDQIGSGMCTIPGFLDICNSHHKFGKKARLCSSYGSSCQFFSTRGNFDVSESVSLGRYFGMCEISGFYDICQNHYLKGIKATNCSAIEPAKCTMSRKSSTTFNRWDFDHRPNVLSFPSSKN